MRPRRRRFLFVDLCVNNDKASYHKSVKKFFGFARIDSMTDIIVSWNYLVFVHNARVRFCAQSSLSCSAIMAHFYTIGVF